MLDKIRLVISIITLIVVLYMLLAPKEYYGVVSTMVKVNESVEKLETLITVQDSISKRVIAPNITKIENHYHQINGIRKIHNPDSLVLSINRILSRK